MCVLKDADLVSQIFKISYAISKRSMNGVFAPAQQEDQC
jgi:hypothetical protein